MTDEHYGPTEAGAVVLEIGADTGALILHTPADLAGREIEISPVSGPARRRHASVRQRRTGGGTGHAAIYDRLPPGSYTIWRDHATPAATITIPGGQVTICHWPADNRGQPREAPAGAGNPEHRHTFPHTGQSRRVDTELIGGQPAGTVPCPAPGRRPLVRASPAARHGELT